MALFTLNVGAQVNQPPSTLGSIVINLNYNDLHVFTLAEFTTSTVPPYADPEGDALRSIRVLTLPSQGTLLLSAVPVGVNDEIFEASITGGLLTYQADPGDTDGYSSNFTWDASDVGSATFAGLTGTTNINVLSLVNSPPTEVGDNTLATDFGTTIVFTAADFTSGTTPPYSDPEGDPASQLQVLSLPAQGQLRLNNVPVSINQIIDFTDIIAGNFTYVTDNTDIDGYSANFNFQVSDSGSGDFTD